MSGLLLDSRDEEEDDGDGAENILMPTNPIAKQRKAPHVLPKEATGSRKQTIPTRKLTRIITEDHVPTAMAIPAVRMAKIPPVPPNTHSNPDNNPHGVKRTDSPVSITNQANRNMVKVLYD